MRNARWTVYVLLVLARGTLYGGSLNLVKEYPDITTNGVKVTYDKLNKLFKATGSVSTLDLDGGSSEYRIDPGIYALTAHIDNGVFLDGTVSISGSLEKSLDLTTVIFTGDQVLGTLTQFGYRRVGTSGGIFEFRFALTGGYLYEQKLFTSNHLGGIIISAANSGTSTNPFGAAEFGSDFTIKGAQVDTFVPAPMALPAGVVLLAGMIGYGGYKRRGYLATSQ